MEQVPELLHGAGLFGKHAVPGFKSLRKVLLHCVSLFASFWERR
jgi:hypothetical protein